MREKALVAFAGTAVAASVLLFTEDANAQLVIKNPSDHPDYRAELEPHGVLVPWGNTFGYGRFRGYGFAGGVGFRATIEIVDNVIPRINNTMGITFGIDFTSCYYCYPDQFALWTPIGVQWNFFLTRKWSVFADLGIAPHSNGFFVGDRGYDAVFFQPMFELGGRFHFRDKITLTMRLGIPFITVGVSFMI